jgi:histidinol phosphatase-like enzyme (inositol monophosphatase family)
MTAINLEDIAKTASRAADRARDETLSRFRRVEVEVKTDGSPVTEADRAAERCIRDTLKTAYPDYAMLGEEYGGEGLGNANDPLESDRPVWVIDPIDGTIAYSRGLPLYSTLIALVSGGESVFGLIDLPALGERYIGWKGGGCRRNGEPVEVSRETDLNRSLISHGDPMCFDRAGLRSGFDRMTAEIPMLRGYTDAFGHAQVLSGGIDAMVDADLNPWDAAATQVLVGEAGGRCLTRSEPSGKLTLVLGSPALVDQLSDMLGF